MSQSNRNSKRKHSAQEEGEAVVKPKKRERVSSDDSGLVSRTTGRVRKKSSKIIEMELGQDDLEEALTGRKSKKKQALDKVAKASNLLQSGKKKKEAESQAASEEHESAINEDEEETETSQAKSSKRSRGKRGDKGTTAAVTPSVSNVIKKEPDGSLKMTLHLGQSPPASEISGTKSAKKSRSKKDKDLLSPLEALQIPEHPDVTSIMEGNSGLKMKLILSPTKDKPAAAFSSPEAENSEDRKKKKKTPKSEGKKKKGKEKEGTGIEKIKIKDILAAQQLARDAKALEQQQLVQQSALAMHLTQLEPTDNPVIKTEPGIKTEPMSPSAESVPFIASPPASEESKSKKKTKKKGKSKQSIPEIAEEIMSVLGKMTSGPGVDDDESLDGNLEIDLTPKTDARKKKEPKKSSPKKTIKKEVDSDVDTTPIDVGDSSCALYANTDLMAMKVMTSQERKANKKTKGKKKGPIDPLKPKKKRRRGPTAYMLWCNSYRNKVIAENPERDFAQISKRLGEIWQGLLEKEKLSWKRKAKKIAAKGSTLISTGKKGQAKITPTGVATKGKAGELGKGSGYEVHSTSPVDVAAHLKLLGESLSIIGNRLTESRGQIAVQGSLSVMLDSLLCALGPLSCLTAVIPETVVVSDEMMANTLDNIAYIMPGL